MEDNSTGVETTESVSETSEAPAVETPKPEDLWEQRFQRLSRTEALAKKEAATLAQKKDVISKYERLEALKSENPLAILDELGLSFEDLVNHTLDKAPEEPVDPTKLELQELRQQLEEIKNKEKSKEDEVLSKKQAELVNELQSALVSSVNPETHKYLSVLDESALKEQLYETAVQMYNNSGKLPDNKEVVDMLNSLYEEQISPFTKLFTGEKVEPKRFSEKTLNSEVNTSIAPNEKNKTRSKEERVARALAILNNK